MSDSQILTSINGNIGTITLNRPDRLNALTPRMAHEFFSAMRRMGGYDSVRVIWGVLLALCACGPAVPLPVPEIPDGLFGVGGRALALHCLSGPSPTIIIDAGLGEASDQWRNIAEKLALHASVCVFDRAGYGESDPGLLPRTPAVNAEELRALLTTAGIRPPLVLVGHSLGALNVQAFWTKYPGDVEGLVLLDPPPRSWLEGKRFPGVMEMAVTTTEDLQDLATRARGDSAPEAAWFETMASEHREMLRVGAAVAGIDAFGDLPLLVVAAGRPNPAFGDSAAAFQQFWVEESQAVAGRSTAGKAVVLDSIGHLMNQEAPLALLDLIRRFLERLKD